MTSPVRLVLLGAGNRGTTYADYAVKTGRAVVVAVAEPDPQRAARARDAYPDAEIHDDWRQLAARPKFADAALVTTQDAYHTDPAVAFAQLGYHMLLEKPMATTEEDARRIIDAVEKAGVMLAVCHVMRYTTFTRGVKGLVDSGVLGEIVSIEHLEPVGWWHHAHSYVRGNWRREDEATPMLLAKSCHDLDWLAYILGKPVKKVSSFGSLNHFRPENRPEGAADRCLDCSVESTCPYSAKQAYLKCVGDPERQHWPLSVLTSDPSEEGVLTALREGPYGRCVYACDNDVVDHQVLNIEYAGGTTASFTMTAFTELAQRKTRIFGTHGRLEGDGVRANVLDFRTGEETEYTFGLEGASAASGHGGGDERLVDAFLDAVATGDPARILSDPRTSLESHLVAWAAERARHNSTVETVTV